MNMKAANIFILIQVLLAGREMVNAFSSSQKDETCCSPWISFNKKGLEEDLNHELFGQHIASRIIINAVSGFMNENNPKKPLVLYLHGTTGTGKNFVSQLIAENIYKEGIKSPFFHLFASTLHFPYSSQIDQYKSQLQQWIRDSVTKCERSMFVFDEMDKMHPGLIDSIKPYLDHFTLDGVSYRKSIFIFLSNIGGHQIAQTALDFWKAGKSREMIELKDLEAALSSSVFNNDQSRFFQSRLIDSDLIDYFVPFLPLKHEHVVLCVITLMMEKHLKPDWDVAKKLASDLVDFPKIENIFSSTGCKTIANKLHFYIKDDQYSRTNDQYSWHFHNYSDGDIMCFRPLILDKVIVEQKKVKTQI